MLIAIQPTTTHNINGQFSHFRPLSQIGGYEVDISLTVERNTKLKVSHLRNDRAC